MQSIVATGWTHWEALLIIDEVTASQNIVAIMVHWSHTSHGSLLPKIMVLLKSHGSLIPKSMVILKYIY